MTQSTFLKTAQKTPAPATKPAAPVAAKPTAKPSHEQIAERARALWAAKGQPAGQDKEIWLEAEAQLKKA